MNTSHAWKALVLLVVSCLIPLAGLADKKENKSKSRQPYLMTLLALKGPATIDVYITIQTTDSVRYPIPTELEKLKVKFLDQQSMSRVVKNQFDVPLVNGAATFTGTDALGALLVEVQVLIKTSEDEDDDNDGHGPGRNDDKKERGKNGKRGDDDEGGHGKEKKYYHSDSDFGDCEEHEVVLKGKINVLLRPDLVVEQVNTPQQVSVNAPFSIEAVIRETKLQVGATATISLYEGATLLGSIPGVQVQAGGQVSAVFQGLTASPTGTHDYTVKISDAVPAEYDITNNSSSFSIDALSPATAMMYSMFSYRYENYYYHYTSTSTCYGDLEQTQTGRMEDFSFVGTAVSPFALHGPFDLVSWDWQRNPAS